MRLAWIRWAINHHRNDCVERTSSGLSEFEVLVEVAEMALVEGWRCQK